MSDNRNMFTPALAVLWLCAAAPAAAQTVPAAIPALPSLAQMAPAARGDASADDDFETKHLFGFTEGVDVGEVGGQEAETEITTAIGKRGGGRYGAEEQELALEFVPVSRFSYELGLHGVSQVMTDAPGMANLAQTTFSGLSINSKFLLLTRGVDAPFGLAVSATPEWDRIDPVTGIHASEYGIETKIHLDAELIAQKLYAGANLLYSPEVENQSGVATSLYSLAGVTGGMAWRLTPNVGLGVEVEYYQAYDLLGFNKEVGSATYIGPTFETQITPKAFLALAWSTQVASRLPDASAVALAQYNQSDLARQRATLIFEYQY